jgi:hypothetical protein
MTTNAKINVAAVIDDHTTYPEVCCDCGYESAGLCCSGETRRSSEIDWDAIRAKVRPVEYRRYLETLPGATPGKVHDSMERFMPHGTYAVLEAYLVLAKGSTVKAVVQTETVYDALQAAKELWPDATDVQAVRLVNVPHKTII